MTYFVRLLLYVVFWAVSILLAPFLPAFAVMRDGPADNNQRQGIEPRLPLWLGWFDTSVDNSLWGDSGWRTKHCPNSWDTYGGMVRWLWRNAACGFSWSVLAQAVSAYESFAVTSSGCGLALDKGRRQQGWFRITTAGPAWQYRLVKEWAGLQFSFEAGWLIDVYLKDSQAIKQQPKALFLFQPSIRRINP